MERRLRALQYPQADAFDASDNSHCVALIAWLEDRHIRQLKVEDRGPLRAGDATALAAYLEELGAPADVRAAENIDFIADLRSKARDLEALNNNLTNKLGNASSGATE